MCDLWEQVGTYAKYGLIDETILLDIVAAQVSNAWKRVWPAIEIIRRRTGPATFENFEYLAVRAELFQRRTPNGVYPRNLPRMVWHCSTKFAGDAELAAVDLAGFPRFGVCWDPS